MKLFKTLTTRLSVVIYLLILQFSLYLGIAIFIVFRYPFVSWIGTALSILVFLNLIKKDKSSNFKLTWIIIVLAFLPLGGFIYLLFGDKRPTRRIASYVKEHALISKYLPRNDKTVVTCQRDDRICSLINYIHNSSSYAPYTKTDVDYYSFGEDMFENLLQDLSEAKKFIFLEFFIIKDGYMWNKILDILLNKADNGIDVRLIIDDFGSMKLFTNRYIRFLRNKGIKIVRFNPLRPKFLMFMNNRDHRKIIVIDGCIAYNSGANIADEYINHEKRFGIWKDTGVRLRGDGVWSFTLMFIEMWDVFCQKDERINHYEDYYAEDCDEVKGDGFVMPYGDSPLDHEQLGENVYIDILHQAKNYVYIFTPYLIISENFIYALQMAAKRGVDVKIITPGIPDKKLVYRLTRSYYRFLLDAGVEIYEYTPGFLHGKSFVCDDVVGVVGTINLDYRSLYLHFECATLMYQSKVILDIKQDFLNTLSASKQVKTKITRNTLAGNLMDSILHLFAPLL